MNKLIGILFSFILLLNFVFADKSRFYENGKIIDTMYVDSEDGLKVRDYPSLKSNRICGLSHRTRVSIVDVAEDDIIDGIQAPWIKIVIPAQVKSTQKYGWVFGGYLSKEKPGLNIDKLLGIYRGSGKDSDMYIEISHGQDDYIHLELNLSVKRLYSEYDILIKDFEKDYFFDTISENGAGTFVRKMKFENGFLIFEEHNYYAGIGDIEYVSPEEQIPQGYEEHNIIKLKK